MAEIVIRDKVLQTLRCPASGEPLHQEAGWLVSESGRHRYRLDPSGIPLFAENLISDEGRKQRDHYQKIAAAYLNNLSYPHTREYMAYLDKVFLAQIEGIPIGKAAEICCGRGEALLLVGDRIQEGLGIDVSVAMLKAAQATLPKSNFFFAQGDATMLPIDNEQFDAVFMLGGIHHVTDRQTLFGEIFRILKPGGNFYWREPVSDFVLWRTLRAIIYRLSPILDHATERPLLYKETVPVLHRSGFQLRVWKTYGFLGFCLLMNSDVLFFNRLFRFVPAIRWITRLSTHLDDLFTRLPGFKRAGLQVVGVAHKP